MEIYNPRQIYNPPLDDFAGKRQEQSPHRQISKIEDKQLSIIPQILTLASRVIGNSARDSHEISQVASQFFYGEQTYGENKEN